MPEIDDLLQRLSRHTLTLADARTELARLTQLPGQDQQHLIVSIHTAVTQGWLDHEPARALLGTIANANDYTQAARTQHHATLGADDTASRTRIPASDLTSIADDDRTQRSSRPDPHTLLRAAPGDQASDGTRVRSEDEELTVGKPYVPVGDPTQAMAHVVAATDVTVRTAAPPPTAARFPPASNGTHVDGPAYARTLGVADKAPPTFATLHEDLRPGFVIKQRFLLDSLIGKGGMGLVFSAIDRRKEEAQDPTPRVALKILNADFQKHPQSFIALQREARKAQTLAHPNVVTVFDFDRDGEAVYMTMELLQGRSLESMVREARGKGIGRDLALPIIRDIAEGLAYAHRKGIVHSDLKPGNIFITTDKTAKILDFGIARAVPNPASAEAPDVFDAGTLGAYTEAYATNEMVNGVDPHPADDMYALGIIGYELLTGFHPFQRHSAPSARKLGIKPAPLKGVRRREARALERCLSFERADRPKNAAEFLKLFRGISTLQKTTFAAAALLAIASSYFWYENYVATSPAIAFSKLAPAVQQEFAQHMAEGDQAWTFFEREQNFDGLNGALEQYSAAYALHPRNRDAVHALNKVADAFLRAATTADERRKVAITLQENSEYFNKYEPVAEAAE